jgi:CNT family concentrative nucleoside transporter
MMYLMGTSGAETLSAVANVFMGQTEAPLIVRPYVAKMTQSELLALMVGGFATIAGSVMALYMGLGADPTALLATSIMAAPCGLYLSKLLLPEREKPLTSGLTTTVVDEAHTNFIDAAAAGASAGIQLLINVVAMLIAFLALLALVNYLLLQVDSVIVYWGFDSPRLSLARIFSWVFAPVAFLMGVPWNDIPSVADLLGTKLAANEFVAFLDLSNLYQPNDPAQQKISKRAYVLATFALTGFANFGSVGIQLGGIGSMAPSRRADLARLGGRALFAGFVATLINAALAGVVLDE